MEEWEKNYKSLVGRVSKLHPNWRRGQAFFNVLANYMGEEEKEAAERLRGSLLDPFYHDDRIDLFLEAVKRILLHATA